MEKNIIFLAMRATAQVVLGQLFANLNHPWTIIIDTIFCTLEKKCHLCMHRVNYINLPFSLCPLSWCCDEAVS